MHLDVDICFPLFFDKECEKNQFLIDVHVLCVEWDVKLYSLTQQRIQKLEF